MKKEHMTDKSTPYVDVDHTAERYVWATNEESRLQGLSAYLIQSIAQRHGGNAQIDLVNQSIDIHVPDQNKVACTREMEDKVGLSLR